MCAISRYIIWLIPMLSGSHTPKSFFRSYVLIHHTCSSLKPTRIIWCILQRLFWYITWYIFGSEKLEYLIFGNHPIIEIPCNTNVCHIICLHVKDDRFWRKLLLLVLALAYNPPYNPSGTTPAPPHPGISSPIRCHLIYIRSWFCCPNAWQPLKMVAIKQYFSS